MKFFLIRYTKLLFATLKLHVIFNIFSSIFLNLYYLTKFSAWVAKNRKISYNDFPSKWTYDKRYPLYKWVLEIEGLTQIPVNYLEFGVAQGHSIRWYVEQNSNPASRFYGFDTFTGLPEDYGPYKKGTFNSNQEQPKIDDTRVGFYQGLFQQTLPGFLAQLDNTKRNIIMLDADLYSATLYVLTSMAGLLKDGDIIFFDEFSVPTHEFKAYSDFLSAYYINLELIGAANNYYFVAFKVKR